MHEETMEQVRDPKGLAVVPETEPTSPPVSEDFLHPQAEEEDHGIKDSFKLFLFDWSCTTAIGFLVVSYWRGTWVLLDILTCDQPGSAGLMNGDSFCFGGSLGYEDDIRYEGAWQSYLAGNLLLVFGLAMLWRGWWKPADASAVRNGPYIRCVILRFAIVYILGAATVNIWRGVWYFIDYYLLTGDALASWWTSTACGAALCYLFQAGASMLAPPSMFILDGPSVLPPPIGVTIITSYRSITTACSDLKPEDSKDPLWLVALDVTISFILLPWGVVGFWRGFWYLMDFYLWGVTADERDLHLSILYSVLIGYGALFIGSEDVVQHIPTENPNRPVVNSFGNQTFGRLRTLVLAIGAVNFWRAVWYIWDEFLGETQTWSAALSHVVGVLGLLSIGSLSCITAPASTLGVDAVAHPECADEPLFHNVPVPYEALAIFGIAQIKVARPVVAPPPLVRLPSVRFTQLTQAQLEPLTVLSSPSAERLSKRHLLKREKSQFFRSR